MGPSNCYKSKLSERYKIQGEKPQLKYTVMYYTKLNNLNMNQVDLFTLTLSLQDVCIIVLLAKLGIEWGYKKRQKS